MRARAHSASIWTKTTVIESTSHAARPAGSAGDANDHSVTPAPQEGRHLLAHFRAALERSICGFTRKMILKL